MLKRAQAWARLPAEMKALPQWCVAGHDKTPLAAGPDGKLYGLSVTNPSGWMTFDAACSAAWHHQLYIGFVLQPGDPFTCIDLDVKDVTNEPNPEKWTTQAQFDHYFAIMSTFDSYTERSRSGKGVHIWVRGNIGRGRRRDGVEVYSQERYILCTGDVIHDVGIMDRQHMLTNMVSQMYEASLGGHIELNEVEATESDEVIIQRAMSASNNEKFVPLAQGRWREMGFPSQSEADLALMSMFTFYSKSNEQCRRLFRLTELGKREKAVKDNRYLDRTLSLIRARESREANIDMKALLAAQNNGIRVSPTVLHATNATEPVVTAPPAAAAFVAEAPVSLSTAAVAEEGIPWPPGLVGAVARFIYESSPRPVKEISIVSALGFMAGLCGKYWNIPHSGLNLYIILVARSAVGKEAMHSGISLLLNKLVERQPTASKYVNFNEFASGPALVKALAESPSFVNVAGEWGRKLKRIAQDDGRDPASSSLRTVMTNLYQKSGATSIVGGISYSNKESNVASIGGVAYSMIGETTPKTFYEALTDSMMEDGFLSRFLIIEYDGQRPKLSINANHTPSEALLQSLVEIVTYATSLEHTNNRCDLQRDGDAAAMLAEFEAECDKQIDSTDDESWRQMWNRASLKVMRIAALLAVGDHYYTPCIRAHHVAWALDVVKRDIALMQRHMKAGDVGVGDAARESKVLDIIVNYLHNQPAKTHRIPEEMRQSYIVPRSYLYTFTHRATAFNNHRMGPNVALDTTIRSMIDNGYIHEVEKTKLLDAYGYSGKAYRIVNIPDKDGQRKR